MISLPEVSDLVKAGPYIVWASREENGHYYFTLGLKITGNHFVPFIFAIPVKDLSTRDGAEAAVKAQLEIVAAEHAGYIKNGLPPGGMPTWG